MAFQNSPSAYGSGTRLFHWAVAALVLFQFGSIVLFRVLEEGGRDSAWTLLNGHKTAGLLVLILTTLRYLWRRLSPLPDWPVQFDAWDKHLTHVVERGLYLAMFGMSLSGIGVELAAGHYVPFFDLFHLDARAGILHAGAASQAVDIKAARAALMIPWLRDTLVGLHVLGAFATLVLLAAHLAHIIRHQVGLRNGLLLRMLKGSAGEGGSTP
jgi:cytochrome b561